MTQKSRERKLSEVKRQPSAWEEITANDTTDRGLISKIYKQLIELNKPIKKWERPKQTCLQRHTDGQHTHGKQLNIAPCQRTQIRTSVSHHLARSEGPSSKSTNNKRLRAVEKREHSCTVGGNVN